MANIITSEKHDIFGKTRSEQEVNMRKEWGCTMTDGQLDKLKYIEKKNKDINGSKKNFIPGHEIDQLSSNSLCCNSSTGKIRVGAGSRGYEVNFDRINWRT